MQIQIKQWSGKNRELLIRNTINHVASLIFSDAMLQTIKTINVKVINSPRATMNNKQVSVHGNAGPSKDGAFDICIKSTLDDINFISILAHELMHVAQFADQRLLMGYEDAFWKSNDRYHRYWIRGESHQEYLDWPWEKEARDFANVYLKHFVLNENSNKASLAASKSRKTS